MTVKSGPVSSEVAAQKYPVLLGMWTLDACVDTRISRIFAQFPRKWGVSQSIAVLSAFEKQRPKVLYSTTHAHRLSVGKGALELRLFWLNLQVFYVFDFLRRIFAHLPSFAMGAQETPQLMPQK